MSNGETIEFSTSAQYRSRSENSKPKKKSFMQDGLNGAARHKDQSVYACYVQRGWECHKERLTSQFRHQQSAWKNHNKMCKEIIAKNEELDPRRRERLDSFLEKQGTMARHSCKRVVGKTCRFSSQHDLLHCVMLPESIAIQMKLISILKWIWEFGCFQLRI